MRGNSAGELRPARPDSPWIHAGAMSGASVSSTSASPGEFARERADAQRPLERGRAAEAEPEAEREIRVGLLSAAVERVGDAGQAVVVAMTTDASQSGQHLILCAAHVQQHRQRELARDLQLLVEEPGLPLDRLGRGERGHEEVETDLADRDETRIVERFMHSVAQGGDVVVVRARA